MTSGTCRISVIVCTHQPKADFLEEVLTALRSQSVSPAEWELLLIDNASAPPLDEALVGWHPHGRIVREPVLGLVEARLAGIRKAQGDVLVWVDDDNVLDNDYLANTRSIAESWPRLGAWGGQLIGRFEVEPEANVQAHLGMLGLRRVERAIWSCLPAFWATAPYGAGMSVRREVAARWATLVQEDDLRRGLGVRGDGLMRGEDLDLAFTAFEFGMGTGLFPELVLTHLMPANRTSFDYLQKLSYMNGYSGVVLQKLHVGSMPPLNGLPAMQGLLLALARRTRTSRRLAVADWRGQRRAVRDLLSAAPPGHI